MTPPLGYERLCAARDRLSHARHTMYCTCTRDTSDCKIVASVRPHTKKHTSRLAMLMKPIESVADDWMHIHVARTTSLGPVINGWHLDLDNYYLQNMLCPWNGQASGGGVDEAVDYWRQCSSP